MTFIVICSPSPLKGDPALAPPKRLPSAAKGLPTALREVEGSGRGHSTLLLNISIIEKFVWPGLKDISEIMFFLVIWHRF
jgi:hypothetical protein